MRIKSQQRKVARPTSISFDQLSVKEDTLTAEMEKQDAKETSEVVANMLNKMKQSDDNDK